MRRVLLLGVPAAAVVVVLLVVLAVRGDDDWKRTTTFPLRRCEVQGVAARCGRLVVPEERRRPRGRTVSLRVVVIPSPRQPAEGALFYLEGGPGGAATEATASVNDLFGKVNANRDLVLVDQRGTGGSNRLLCPEEHVRFAAAGAMAAYVRRCFGRLHADPRLYTTAAAADDLDAVRRALDYGRIDLYGGSYGATVAQVYLDRHGRSVRTVVLDSASLLGVPLYELAARNGERALRLTLARCAAEPACRSAFPRTRAELSDLITRGPRLARPLGHDPVVLSGDDVASTVQALSRTPAGAARIPLLVHEAAGGDYETLSGEFVGRVGAELDERARLVMSFEILCSEPWARFGVAATARASGGSYLRHVTLARARVLRRMCRSVPRGFGPPGSTRPPRSRVPVLLLAGAADPQDPPANLRGWRDLFPNGRLVVVPGLGHGVVAEGCLPLVVARFVGRGSARGLDTRCARRIPLPPFETGS